jgi:hypothetical protein
VGGTESYAPSREVFFVSTTANGGGNPCFVWGGLSNDQGNCVFEINDPLYQGDIMILGYTQSFGAGSADALLLRIPAGGGPAIYKTYGTPGWEELTRGEEILAGPWVQHLIATGISQDPNGNGAIDLLLYKDNVGLPFGPQTFANLYGGALDDFGFSVAHDPVDDGYIAAGYTRNFPVPNGTMNLYLVKTDNTGFSGCQQRPGAGVTHNDVRDYFLLVPHSSRIRTQCETTAQRYDVHDWAYICPPTPIAVPRPGQLPEENGNLSINQGTPEAAGSKRDGLSPAVEDRSSLVNGSAMGASPILNRNR